MIACRARRKKNERIETYLDRIVNVSFMLLSIVWKTGRDLRARCCLLSNVYTTTGKLKAGIDLLQVTLLFTNPNRPTNKNVRKILYIFRSLKLNWWFTNTHMHSECTTFIFVASYIEATIFILLGLIWSELTKVSVHIKATISIEFINSIHQGVCPYWPSTNVMSELKIPVFLLIGFCTILLFQIWRN